MKRRLLLIALLLSTMAAAPTNGLPPVGTAPALPIAGEVTIHAEAGLHGIRLALPDVEGLAVDNDLSTIDELYEGDYGLVQLFESGVLNGDLCTTAALCPLHNIEALPGATVAALVDPHGPSIAAARRTSAQCSISGSSPSSR